MIMSKTKIITYLLIIVFIAVISVLFPLRAKTSDQLHEAKFWEKSDSKIQCRLCPSECLLSEGETGRCRVRINKSGKLYTLVYGKAVAKNVDPIEKKPVFHLLPGSTAYSIATAGCNLRCKFCQNWQISQSAPNDFNVDYFPPEDVVKSALQSKSASIAYTYNEPTVFYEYVLDTAKLAKKKGLRNILVSSGFINEEPMKELLPYFDVIKIDLKGFNEKFYKEVTEGKLQAVLNTLLTIRKNSKVIVEVVNLVVPGLNDDINEVKKMCKWIKENLGSDTPVFFSKFYPNFQLRNIPETPIATLEKCREAAMKEGLNYVYIGNVAGHPAESTYCPKCKKVLIARTGYFVGEVNIVKGKCKFCGKEIPGIWE